MALEQYMPIIVAAVVVVALSFFTLEVVWRILRAHNPNPAKYEIYECGEIAIGETKFTNIEFKYYVYAIMFLVFDVEAVFLFPWAVEFKSLGLMGYIEAIIFIALLFTALIYAINQNILKWTE